MSAADETEPILKPPPPITAGVWGARNYHTTLEQRAIAGARMTSGYIAMAVAAAVMATAGLLLDSAAVVIGSMCIAPFIAPSRAVCIGALFGNWRVFAGGLVKQLFGLLGISVGVALLITLALQHSVGGLEITHEILLRSMPSERDVILSALIAATAGAVASLALVTQPHLLDTPWGQVLDALIGVEISISLVPPAAVIGITWVLGVPHHGANAIVLLLLNVVGLDLFGSVIILAGRGVRRRHLNLEKRIRATTARTLETVPDILIGANTVDVTLMRSDEVQLEISVRKRFDGMVPDSLATTIAEAVERATGCHCEVSMEVIPLLTTSASRPREDEPHSLPDGPASRGTVIS